MFNSGVQIAFSKSSTPWNGQTSSGCIVDNVISEIQYQITEASPKISNNILNLPPTGRSGCIIRIYGGSPIIANNITGQTLEEYLAPDNGAAIDIEKNCSVTITGNIIQTVNTGIDVCVDSGNGTVIIKRNLISNTHHGVDFVGNINITFEENTITQSNYGIYLTGAAGQLLFTNGNSIYANNNNIGLQHSNLGWFTVKLSNNWWEQLTLKLSTHSSQIHN